MILDLVLERAWHSAAKGSVVDSTNRSTTRLVSGEVIATFSTCDKVSFLLFQLRFFISVHYANTSALQKHHMESVNCLLLSVAIPSDF